ncbi:MAG: polysaccharide biosynthesis C-terminal domain-containing protein [Chitinophagaceae bacterium]
MRQYVRTASATTIQMVANQFFGLLFFLGMALLLPKDLFGRINWAIAVCATLTIISSLGFDHVIVGKLGAGETVKDTVGVYIGHTILLALIGVSGLAIFHWLKPSFFQHNPEFIAIYAGLFATFMSMPFKQLANGKQHFGALAWMGVSGNFFKVVILFSLYFSHAVNDKNIALLFLISGLLEWIFCFAIATGFSGKILLPTIDFSKYKALVFFSFPQLGVILLDSAFARIDWILMGIISTNALTADYSFAYKAYESSRLPLLIIAPIILPKLSKLYSQGGISKEKASELNFLWRAESLICVVIPLLLNICWDDVVNLVTHNRYGVSTRWVYAVLSLSLPMAYIINYLWTIAFSTGRLRLTFYFTAITLGVNFGLNLILIPLYGALGAAIAFTTSTAVQMVLYIWRVREPKLSMRYLDFALTCFSAIALVALTTVLPIHWFLKLVLAFLLYTIFAKIVGLVSLRRPFILRNDKP